MTRALREAELAEASAWRETCAGPSSATTRRWLRNASGVTALASSLALWLAATPTPALTLEPLTPADVVDASAQIVIGRVEVASEETQNNGAVVEHLEIHVVERWKGDGAGDVIEVPQWVGVWRDGVLLTVAGLPRLEDGTTYLLFLPPASEVPSMPVMVNGPNGAFVAHEENEGWRFESLSGLRLLGVTAERLWFDVPQDDAVAVPDPEFAGTSSNDDAAERFGDPETTWRNMIEQRGAP